jgi:hypothetical protein
VADILHEFLSLLESNAVVSASDKCFEHSYKKKKKTRCQSLAQPDSSVPITVLDANDVSQNAKIVTVLTFASYKCA